MSPVLCRFPGRLPSARVDGGVMQASEKPAHKPTFMGLVQTAEPAESSR